jgi:hypothetical protein
MQAATAGVHAFPAVAPCCSCVTRPRTSLRGRHHCLLPCPAVRSGASARRAAAQRAGSPARVHAGAGPCAHPRRALATRGARSPRPRPPPIRRALMHAGAGALGGRGVIEEIEKQLALTADLMQPSKDTLHRRAARRRGSGAARQAAPTRRPALEHARGRLAGLPGVAGEDLKFLTSVVWSVSSSLATRSACRALLRGDRRPCAGASAHGAAEAGGRTHALTGWARGAQVRQHQLQQHLVRAGEHRVVQGRAARRPRVADRLRQRLQVQQRGLARAAQRQGGARGLALGRGARPGPRRMSRAWARLWDGRALGERAAPMPRVLC